METKIQIIVVLLLSGCICYADQPELKPEVVYYVSTTSTIISTTTSTTGTTTTTVSTVTTTTTTTTTVTLKTEETNPYTLRNYPGHLADKYKPWEKQLEPKKPRKIIVPESFQTCDNDKDCVLVYDCCGTIGHQYTINKLYKTLWNNNLACYLKENTKSCGLCELGMCRLNYYTKAVCYNQTCEKSYS